MKILRGIIWLGLTGQIFGQVPSPGALDSAAVPSLWQPGAPVAAGVAGGRIWVAAASAGGWPGFRQADGHAVGDLLWLGESGGVEEEGWPGYLGFAAPFPLESGEWLAKSRDGVWWRLSAGGAVTGRAFPGAEGQLEPFFEAEGRLWVQRREATGRLVLEVRKPSDGSLEPGISITAPGEMDVLAAVAAPEGGAWVVAGDEMSAWHFLANPPPDQQLFRLRADGSVAAGPVALAGDRSVRMWSGGPGVRLCLGPASSRWAYWPSPESLVHTLQWRSGDGALLRESHLATPIGSGLVVAEAEDASLIAGPAGGILRKYPAAGGVDEAFAVSGVTRTLTALPDGKWLADGADRLLADGSPDPAWTSPSLEEAAAVRILRPAAGGSVLVAGEVHGQVALLRPDGSVDPSFTADARLGRVADVEAVTGGWLVVTSEAVPVREDLMSNLVKLRSDGSLDEDFTPQLSPFVAMNWMNEAADVAVLAGGDLLVTVAHGGDVRSWQVHRLAADGSRRANSVALPVSYQPQVVLPLSGGGFVRGAVIHAADGTVSRDLTRTGATLEPLTEWRGGVLFLERPASGVQARLRWWKGRGWVAGFRPPAVDGWPGVRVTPGEGGHLYLHAGLAGSRPALRRLLPGGQLDRTFRSAAFATRARTDVGPWWTLGENGREDLREAPVTGNGDASGLILRVEGSEISSLVWSGGRLWVGGSFHEVDGQPRTGLARFFGGKAQPVRRGARK